MVGGVCVNATPAVGKLLYVDSIGGAAWCSVMTHGVGWSGWEGGFRGRGCMYTYR